MAIAALGSGGARQGCFVEIGKFADADQRQIACFDQRFIVAATRVQLRAHAAIIHLLGQPARRFDGLEHGPGLLGQLLGQGFNIPTSARGIRHMADMTFFLQNNLRVAGDATRQHIVAVAGGRTGGDADKLGSCNAGGQRGNGRAQNIHPRVEPRIGALAGFAMNGRHDMSAADIFGDHVKKLPRTADLGNGHEEIGIRTQRQGNAGQGFSGKKPVGFQNAQVFRQRGKHIGQLIRWGRAFIMKRRARSCHQVKSGQVCRARHQCLKAL